MHVGLPRLIADIVTMGAFWGAVAIVYAFAIAGVLYVEIRRK